MTTPRLIANYLPQYHPVPENDRFWGRGFTEWTNVSRAKPLFPGHYQPHIPADLGYYDLRVPETREQQAELACEAGIEGFCYWHYWFGAGRLILERPLREVVASGKPDFPFCVGWANESWTGVWHGSPGKTLVEQTYPGEKDIIDHFHYLLPAFADPRYLRVDGKPLFLIFRPMQIPQLKRHLETWRELAEKAGLGGLFLVAYEQDKWEPSSHGFDAATWAHQSILKWVHRDDAKRHARHKETGLPRDVYSFEEAIPWMHGERYPDFPLDESHFPSIVTGWDNSPRCGAAANILTDFTPDSFRKHVRLVLQRVRARRAERQIVFVKSWNEWAEGNYLEPEVRFGKEFLKVLREELNRLTSVESSSSDFEAPSPPATISMPSPDPVSTLPEHLNRRYPGAQLGRLPAAFFALKDARIAPLVKQVVEARSLSDASLLDPTLSELDERVLEYAYAAQVICQMPPRQKKLQVLDVGCVLNNLLIEPAIRSEVDTLWLMNPSMERPAFASQIAYLLGDARHFEMPQNLSFDLVTCLSTLEHFGMDNKRYGGSPAEFKGLIEDPERYALDGIAKMSRWVNQEGQILLSVPFGQFEYLYLRGKPTEPIYYTYDKSRLARLKDRLEASGFSVTAKIYKTIPKLGWVPTTVDDEDILDHADGCASAGAVALLHGKRAASKR